MTTTVPSEEHGIRRRKHFRGYRRVKVVLLALGIAGMVIGAAFSGGYVIHENINLCLMGVTYILVSAILLGVRGILIYISHSHKHE